VADRPFLPNKADARKFCLVVGIASLALACVQIISPTATMPSGRWSFITRPVFEVFGAYGLAGLSALIGALLIGIALGRRQD